ncbi:methylamine utilization protein [Massilia terrae]|uniref:Methylamine utilization protein n=1 Tax=Massilia terrae TaxID=1811224 RepID=A0ABT2CTH5_9BURK|nr:methylamine utilization protein [Massilia terrae]MCS0657286.1 methylamine utilization protein [Massilia terrae]
MKRGVRTLLAAAALALSCGAGAATLEALVLNPAGQAVADAAVVLEPLAPVALRGRPTASIEQRGREFIPYLTVVQAGTAIDFPNNDTIRHHVYSFSPPKQFEIKLYAGKPGQPIVFDKPGTVVIGCNIHDWMEAYVLVVETPWFAKTGADGRALLRNVPPGRYHLRLWHPLQKAQPAVRDIEVADSPAPLRLALDVKPREHKPHTEDADHY